MNNNPDQGLENPSEQPLGYPSVGGLMTGNVHFGLDENGHAQLSQDVVGTYNLSNFQVGVDELSLTNKTPHPAISVIERSSDETSQSRQLHESHPQAPTLADLVDSGELNPEGKDMISGCFGKIIMQLERFLADESSTGLDEPLTKICNDMVEKLGPVEAKRQISEAVTRLKDITVKVSGLLAAMPAKIAMAGLWDQEFGNKDGGSQPVTLPGHNVQVKDIAANPDYYNVGFIIPIILTVTNHIINVDIKKTKYDDYFREALRAAISIAIFFAFYDHPVWMKGGAAAANELLGLFAMYGYKVGGPTRNPIVRYSATIVTQFLATWGLL